MTFAIDFLANAFFGFLAVAMMFAWFSWRLRGDISGPFVMLGGFATGYFGSIAIGSLVFLWLLSKAFRQS